MAITDDKWSGISAKKQCIVKFDIATDLDLSVLFSQEQSRSDGIGIVAEHYIGSSEW